MKKHFHGLTHTPTYRVWHAMKQRCGNPTNSRYYLYGGRGIKVCAKWIENFEAFLADMGSRPAGLTLDRIDPNGDYEPSNCRWATPAQQSRNHRRNRMITYAGETLCLLDWAGRLGFTHTGLASRLKRLPLHEAMKARTK